MTLAPHMAHVAERDAIDSPWLVVDMGAQPACIRPVSTSNTMDIFMLSPLLQVLPQLSKTQVRKKTTLRATGQ